jgi:hypothetical protein
MLTSPITVTIDGVAHSLSRIGDAGEFGSIYLKKGTGFELRLTARHSKEKSVPGQAIVERHNIELVRSTFNVDGSVTISSVYTVMRTPQNVDPTAASKDVIGLNAFLTANALAFQNWES